MFRLYTFRRLSTKFSQPRPLPLGNLADQKEFQELVKKAEMQSQSQERLDEINENERAKKEFEGWEGNVNPITGEVDGPKGKEPTRYGDWERKGRVYDF